jgi:ubiquinol-cytochrome c reductase cytochrome b subunit
VRRRLLRLGRGFWCWIDERSGLGSVLDYAFRHPVPAALAGAAGWLYVFGTAILVVFVLQVLTGIGLATVYVPSPADAYDSLQFITEEATLGRFMRGLHYFGASAMVVLVVLHMARVFLMGSYKFPRELGWLSGVVLLALVFIMAFTGQLLRWDSDSIASVQVAIEQVGRLPVIGEPLARFILAGKTIGGATLTRFFVIHVFVGPILIALVIGFHLYLVLKNGISEPPRGGEPVDPRTYRHRYNALLERGRPYFPDMMWREIVFAALVVGFIVALALTLGPRSLRDVPDPTETFVEPRPDWYLLWLFALFSIIPPRVVEDALIIFGPIATVVVLVLIPLLASKGERSPFVRPWAVIGVVLVFVVLIALTQLGRVAPWEPRFDTEPLTAAAIGADDPRVLQGALIFHAKGCQYCHGVKGEGGIRGRDLTRVMLDRSDAVVVGSIFVPPAGMPSYANNMTTAELESLIAFLRALADSEP